MANTAENPRRQVTLEKAFQDSRQLFKHCFSCVSGGKTVVNRIAEYTSLKSEPAASNHCKRKPWDPHSSEHATREWVCSTYVVIRTGPGEPAPRGHHLVYTLPHFSGRIPLFSRTKKPREQLGQDVSTMILMGTNSWKPWGGGGASVSQCREWHSWMGSMKWRGVSDTWVTYGSHHGIGGRIPTADSCRQGSPVLTGLLRPPLPPTQAPLYDFLCVPAEFFLLFYGYKNEKKNWQHLSLHVNISQCFTKGFIAAHPIHLMKYVSNNKTELWMITYLCHLKYEPHKACFMCKIQFLF